MAGTALAVGALVGSGQPGSHPADAQLAAWTVATQTNGDIGITINQLHNPIGLQNTLRADGLPVNVTFSGHSASASCQLYPTSTRLLTTIAHFRSAGATARSTVYIVINPSALPAGADLALYVGGNDDIPVPTSAQPGTAGGISQTTIKSDDDHARTVAELTVSPVYATHRCTG